MAERHNVISWIQEGEKYKKRETILYRMNDNNLHRILDDADRNSLLYWFPKIKDLDIPQPKTIIVEIPADREDLEKAGGEIGYPLFMRTDHASAKHNWDDTCYVPSEKDLHDHIFTLMDETFMLPTTAIVFREFIELNHKFKAFDGLPIAKERRYFVKDVAIQCFPGDIEITLANFEKKQIHSIKIGDKVLCESNGEGKVVKLFKRKYLGEIFEIWCIGNTDKPLTVTPNHKIFCIRKQDVLCKKGFPSNYKELICTLNLRGKKSTDYCNTSCDGTKWEICEVRADELREDDYLVIPMNTKAIDYVINVEKLIGKQIKKKHDINSKCLPKKIKVDKKFMRWAGYYLAEGSFCKSHIRFGFNISEKEYVAEVCDLTKRIFGLTAIPYQYPSMHCTVVTINSKWLGKLIGILFGKGAKNKCFLLKEFMLVKPIIQREALKSWLNGDGHREVLTKRCNKIRGCTISRSMAYQMLEIATRNKLIAGIHKSDRKNKKNSAYYVYLAGKHAERLQGIYSKEKRFSWQHQLQDYILTPITEIRKRKYEGIVYNFEVDKIHKYVANRVLVSNCHHHYWIKEAIRFWSWNKEIKEPSNWLEQLEELNREDEDEVRLLSKYALEVAGVLEGYWSVDFAQGKDGTWYLIDCALGNDSFHHLDCKYCPQEQREHYGKRFACEKKDKENLSGIEKLGEI